MGMFGPSEGAQKVLKGIQDRGKKKRMKKKMAEGYDDSDDGVKQGDKTGSSPKGVEDKQEAAKKMTEKEKEAAKRKARAAQRKKVEAAKANQNNKV